MSTHSMESYIGGSVMVNTMLDMLLDELDTGSKTIYPGAMEAIVHYQKYTIKQFGDIIM